MYTRYELYLEGEPQDVGFIVGLCELDLDDDVHSQLLEEFDNYLPLPCFEISEDVWRKHPQSYFTEKGLERFQIAIKQLLNAYAQHNLFDVVKIETTLKNKKIVYQDKYQVLAI